MCMGLWLLQIPILQSLDKRLIPFTSEKELENTRHLNLEPTPVETGSQHFLSTINAGSVRSTTPESLSGNQPWWSLGRNRERSLDSRCPCEFGADSWPLHQDEHLRQLNRSPNKNIKEIGNAAEAFLNENLKIFENTKSWSCCSSCPPYSIATRQCFKCIVYTTCRHLLF